MLVNLVTTNLSKEITKKEYYKEIENSGSGRDRKMLEGDGERGLLEIKRERINHLSYHEIKETVERKWWQEDEQK